MSRSDTAIPIIDMTLDTWTDHSAGTVIDHADGMYVDAKSFTGKLFLRIDHTTDGDKDVTITAPTANPHAPRAPLGNLVINMKNGNSTVQRHAIVLESARFAHADGEIKITFANDTLGNVWAYRLPRGG
jgi:hypothetical protein